MNGSSAASNATPATSKPLRLPFTFVEYFAGIGLFRMGLEQAGWQVVHANDWSAERAQMYNGFFGESYPVKDVFSLTAAELPKATLATCSFPCIDLSLAGKREGINGRHSGAFWGFHDILKKQGEEAPPIVLLENVTGWLYSNGGNDFCVTAKSLNELGYACDVILLDARSFVPQSRPRLFMVGVRSADLVDESPYFTSRSKRLMPPRLKSLMLQNDDIQWARLDIPEPPPYLSDGFSDRVVEKLSDNDSRWWPEQKVEKHLAMMSPSHLEMVKNLACRPEERFRTFFRRRRAQGQRAEVRPDDIAGCLRTAVGGSGKQFLVSAGDGNIRMRTLTPREYARLQGVPDSFPIIANSERQSLSAFGDAVCVPVVHWIATQVLRPLAETLPAGPDDLQGVEPLPTWQVVWKSS